MLERCVGELLERWRYVEEVLEIWWRGAERYWRGDIKMLARCWKEVGEVLERGWRDAGEMLER